MAALKQPSWNERVVAALRYLGMATCGEIETYFKAQTGLSPEAIHESVSACLVGLKKAKIVIVDHYEKRSGRKGQIGILRLTGIPCDAALIQASKDQPQVRCRLPKKAHETFGVQAFAHGFTSPTRRVEFAEFILNKFISGEWDYPVNADLNAAKTFDTLSILRSRAGSAEVSQVTKNVSTVRQKRRELRSKVLSFRIPPSVEAKLMQRADLDAGLNSPELVARKMLLDALIPVVDI